MRDTRFRESTRMQDRATFMQARVKPGRTWNDLVKKNPEVLRTRHEDT